MTKFTCYVCSTPLTWGGDHDTTEDDSQHMIVSNFTCSNCGSYVEVWHGDKEGADD